MAFTVSAAAHRPMSVRPDLTAGRLAATGPSGPIRRRPPVSALPEGRAPVGRPGGLRSAATPPAASEPRFRPASPGVMTNPIQGEIGGAGAGAGAGAVGR